jgi:hypothetical protein
VSFSDYIYCFPINFELFCSDLSVFDIPEFIGRYPFLTFPFTDSDRTKNYAGENGESFFRPLPIDFTLRFVRACSRDGNRYKSAGFCDLKPVPVKNIYTH